MPASPLRHWKDGRMLVMNKPKLIDAETAKQIATDHLTNPYEVISARAVIDKTPAIDPIHAAGGCYCRECRFRNGTIPGNSNILCYQMHDDDFCSYGEIEDQ